MVIFPYPVTKHNKVSQLDAVLWYVCHVNDSRKVSEEGELQMLDSINMSLGYHVSLVEGYSFDKEVDELVLVILVHTLEQLNESWLAKSWCSDDRLDCI